MGKPTLQAIDKKLPGGSNMGGLTQTIYYAYWADVESWPTPPDPEATDLTMAANGVLTGDIVMKTGKQFFPFYMTDDTGEFKIEDVGEKDGKSDVAGVSFFHPSLNDELLGFKNATKNENMVFIVPDNNGNFFLMGDALRPCTYNGSPDGAGTGKETAARAGISFEFTYKTKGMLKYKSTVPLTAAV